jgi:hypothetical protein
MPVEEFVQDVMSTESEVHVLWPTRYEGPTVRNEIAVEKNRRLVCDEPAFRSRNKGPRDVQEAHVSVLRMYGRARVESWRY